MGIASAHDYSQEFQALITTAPDQIPKYDIAYMNLLCAHGLPGAEDLDIPKCMRTLDEWTASVRTRTDQGLARFRALNRGQHTEAQFRLCMVVRALREVYGVFHYLNPDKGSDRVGIHDPGEGGFEDSAPLLIHGCLSERRIGSCSSLPVLFAAVGRRLGYPVRLVLSVGHAFIRWDDGAEKFNVEGTGADYITIEPDEYYLDTPRRWDDQERYGGYYLRSATPAEELASFCIMRAACLHAHHRFQEALECCRRAMFLAPGDPMYPRYMDRLLSSAPLADRLELLKTPLSPGEADSGLWRKTAIPVSFPGPPVAVLAAEKTGAQAEILAAQGKVPEAVVMYAKASRLDPRSVKYRIVLESLASIRPMGTGGPGVRAQLPRGSNIPDPDLATYVHAVGLCYETRGNVVVANTAYQEAAFLAPKDPIYRSQFEAFLLRVHRKRLGAKGI